MWIHACCHFMRGTVLRASSGTRVPRKHHDACYINDMMRIGTQHMLVGRGAKAQQPSKESATIEAQNTETKQSTRRRTGRGWIHNLNPRRRVDASRQSNVEKLGDFIGREQVFRLNIPLSLTFDLTVHVLLGCKRNVGTVHVIDRSKDGMQGPTTLRLSIHMHALFSGWQCLESRNTVVGCCNDRGTSRSRHGVTDKLSRLVRVEIVIKDGAKERFREEDIDARDVVVSKIIIDLEHILHSKRDIRARVTGIHGKLGVINRQHDTLSIFVALVADGGLTVGRSRRKVLRELSISKTDVFLDAIGTKILPGLGQLHNRFVTKVRVVHVKVRRDEIEQGKLEKAFEAGDEDGIIEKDCVTGRGCSSSQENGQ
jgi:hypothetical protein